MRSSARFNSGDHVDTWDPIFPSPAYDVGASNPNYWGTNACAINPAVGLDASWINPYKVTAFGETAATYQRAVWGAQLTSDWINA